jgi:hypothetical protein
MCYDAKIPYLHYKLKLFFIPIFLTRPQFSNFIPRLVDFMNNQKIMNGIGYERTFANNLNSHQNMHNGKLPNNQLITTCYLVDYELIIIGFLKTLKLMLFFFPCFFGFLS